MMALPDTPHIFTSNPIRICSWNARNIIDKKVELEALLNPPTPDIDIFVFQETRLYKNYHFNIHGYTPVRKDNETYVRLRGLLTMIKKGMPFEVIN